MRHKILSVLKQPYPFYYYPNRMVKISLAIIFLITVFLIIFKPFDTNIDELRYNYFITSIIYGVAASLSFFTTVAFLTNFFPEFCKEEKWTIAKELLVIVLLFFIIGNVNFFIRNLVNTNPDNCRIAYYFEELIHTALVGIFPIWFFTTLNFYFLNKANNEKACIFDSIIGKKEKTALPSSPTIVKIASQSIYETVSIDINEIGFIRSYGNYIEICQIKVGSTKKYIIRNTLKDIEKQLSSYTNIVKTHRSYLVNINYIRSVKGNAQGYTLYLIKCNNTVPVSRNNIQEFDSVIKGLSL